MLARSHGFPQKSLKHFMNDIVFYYVYDMIFFDNLPNDFFFLFSGSFLYLLGQPRSDVANFTDKRVISELIRETGNNCTVTVTMRYQNIEGAVVEFGTQNLAKAYSAIKFLTFTRENRTSMG